MARTRRRLLSVAAAWAVLSFTTASDGYDDFTHKALNAEAVRESSLEDTLRRELGLTGGLEQMFNDKRLIDWFVDAGVEEDSPVTRTRNHFHHPLRAPWRTAGLADVFSGASSVLWAQDPRQGFAWQDARRAYWSALSMEPLAGREVAFGMAAQALGHLLHLIADSSVPAHARNDQHAFAFGDPYERWVEAQAAPSGVETEHEAQQRFLSRFTAGARRPDREFLVGLPILGQNATDAPIPIARLWDSDLYDGSNPSVAVFPRIGISEYTNANVFSEDTIFADAKDPSHKHFSPFPSSVDVEQWTDPANNRKYWRKRAGSAGEPVQHLATVSKRAFWGKKFDVSLPTRGGLDEAVHEEYAYLQLPAAVGYSAALLDYFFRGKLEATIEADPGDSEKLQLSAKNASSEALDRGTLAVYGDYAGGERRPLGSWPVPGPVAPGGDLPSRSFSPDRPIPTRYMVVYQGDLGEEKKDNPPGFGGAVIGKALTYGGALEELILFRTPDNTYDVYFRNQFQITLLGLSADLPVVLGYGVFPPEVHWGADSNHFFLKGYEHRTVANREIRVPVYLIYKINRPDNSVSGDEPVQAKLVKTIRPPETPLPYRRREIFVNREYANTSGQMVYPYGVVFTAPSVGVHTVQSEQEVLSEDLGNGKGLEIYALFQAEVIEEVNYLEPGGGTGRGFLGVSLIMQASTGAIVYEDPISGSYQAQAAASASHGHYAVAQFYAWPRTWIVSWSDKDLTKRRWVTQLQVDDFYLTYDWTLEQGFFNDARHFVENSVQTVLIEDGLPKFSITPKRPYVGIAYDRTYVLFYPAAIVPTMSSEKWLWVDEPDLFTSLGPDEKGDVDILRRTQYLMSTETGTKQRVGERTPLDETQYLVAPKIREMVMLQPGFLYAHGEPVYAIPVLSGYDEDSWVPLAQDLTGDGEKQKFVSFLSPDGQIDPAFTTAAPLMEDPDLRSKGRVRTDSYPPGFQAVLDALLNPNSTTKISWHVVPDPDLVPARRR